MDTADAYRLLSAESSVWAMDPAAIEALAATLASGVKAVGRGQTAPPPPSQAAIIPIFGSITYRENFLSDAFGFSTVSGIRRNLATALSDRQVDRIILWIDSPGGVVTGIPELADEIRAARSKKQIIGVADGMAGSAAYWLMSAASELVVNPSGEVGSIGVFAMHLDQSVALKKAGLKPTFISAGPHKIEGNSFEPLGDEARAAVQADVDAYYDMFLEGVAQGRLISKIKVKHEFGGGRMLMADKALAAGMVDRVATFSQALSHPSTSAARRRAQLTVTPAAKSLEERRRRQKLLAAPTKKERKVQARNRQLKAARAEIAELDKRIADYERRGLIK